MDSKFNVVYTGLREDVSAEEFTNKFCAKFGLSETKAKQIVASTSDVVIKKDLDESKAEKYAKAFADCGMLIRVDDLSQADNGLSLEPIVAKPEPKPEIIKTPEPDLNPEGLTFSTCPKCGSDQIEGVECQACGIFITKYLETQKKKADEELDNPYATPEASLDKDFISKEGQGSLEGALNGDYELSLREIFREAWDRVGGVKGQFWLSLLFYIVAAIVLGAVIAGVSALIDPMVGSILSSFITFFLYPILAGITLLGIHCAVGAPIKASSVLGHYKKIMPLALLGFGTGLLTMLGFILLVIPGIYLMIAYMHAMSLMIDRNMGVWEAMETSRKAIGKHWFQVFGIYFVLWLVMILASIPMMIGLIWAIPMTFIVHGIVYKKIFGVESVA